MLPSIREKSSLRVACQVSKFREINNSRENVTSSPFETAEAHKLSRACHVSCKELNGYREHVRVERLTRPLAPRHCLLPRASLRNQKTQVAINGRPELRIIVRKNPFHYQNNQKSSPNAPNSEQVSYKP